MNADFQKKRFPHSLNNLGVYTSITIRENPRNLRINLLLS